MKAVIRKKLNLFRNGKFDDTNKLKIAIKKESQ